ncbi:MAG: L,D-transpeptidase family protein [Mariprofundales bacterium]|nr:L,D-transpeptidase family protein [Mariprofundales bacterium]
MKLPIRWLLVIGFVASCGVGSDAHAAAAQQDWSRVKRALASNSIPEVQRMTAGDRLALQAVLALKQHQEERALQFIASAKSTTDPLLDMIAAEAHRRQALKALHRAGGYAGSMRHQQQMLTDAALTAGLGEAETKLKLLRDHLATRQEGNPVDLLTLSPMVANVFMVDKANSRLRVFAPNADGGFTKLADEYVVTGAHLGDKQKEGDERSPDGIYQFIRRLSGRGLEARYGPVAFPINYPNVLDLLHHKSGHGIWLHGYAPSVSRRPPRNTNGCFSLPNARLQKLASMVKLGRSWVVVGNHLRFGNEAARKKLRLSVEKSIAAWLNDWASLNSTRYLSHYAQKFYSGGRNLAAWKRYKRRVNKNKRQVDVQISNLTLIHDPNRWPEGEVVVAQFLQRYHSNNYHDVTTKRLYLVRKSVKQPWKILSEEKVMPIAQ